MIRWLEFPVDQYLVQRHPNWVLAEEFGDVRFSGETVFVNRERAEHIAQMLLGGRDALVLEDALALPARTGVGVARVQAPQPRRSSSSAIAPAGATSSAGSPSWLALRCSSRRWRCRSVIRRCSWRPRLWCEAVA
jgi:hypothetical protein